VSEAHLRMGTRSLPEDQWLLRDHHAEREIALRRRLLTEQRDLVFACTPHAGPAAEEASALVAGHLGRAPLDVDRDQHPLIQAGASVQEDLCLMVHHDGAWHLEGAVLCFPSLWVLSDKLGRPTPMVHAPVPHYAEELSERVDTFFDRLKPGRLVWRRNFSIWPELLLWAPCVTLDPEFESPVPPAGVAPDLWIRSERQTLQRLPETDAILFTIRVQVAAIAGLAQRPDRAHDLAQWLDSPNGAVRRQQMGASVDHLLGWLQAIG
jgi:heme-dependent oxidative N-demethylase alpha subunit-like protein